jgi:hypothetical protein
VILRHLPSLSAKVYIGEGGVNVELIVVIVLVAVFYGGIAFLIWKNQKTAGGFGGAPIGTEGGSVAGGRG